MVTTLLRSALREIRQSLGRYLAILAIVGLGVGFFAGLRTCQPAMMETGVQYLDTYPLYDFRLLSTLGFTEEDVAAMAALDGVSAAHGAVYTDFLAILDGEETVLKAHSLTEGVNTPELVAGRMPEAADECLADARHFTEGDLGTVLAVAGSNNEDTRELLRCGGYTIVGLCHSPYYLNYERGTGSIGSGSISAFVYIPKDGFDFEAYYEIFLTLTDPARAYSDAYEAQIDRLTPLVEDLTAARAEQRYDDIRGDALQELADAERELADGWEEYRTERADVERELADAWQELMDGEQAYLDGLADYEQGQADYADGLQKYRDGVAEMADAEQALRDAEQELLDAEQTLTDARQELDDGWQAYYDGKADAERELADAEQKLLDGEAAYADGAAELADAEQELADAAAQIRAGERQLADVQAELEAAAEELAAGQENYAQLLTLYQTAELIAAGTAEKGFPLSVEELIDRLQAEDIISRIIQQQVDTALREKGSSLEAFLGAWTMAEGQLKAQFGPDAKLDPDLLAVMEKQLADGQAAYDQGLAQVAASKRQLDAARSQLAAGEREVAAARRELADARQELDDGWAEYYDGKAEAEQELADAYQKLTDGEREYADGVADYEQGLADYRQGVLDYEDGLRELRDAERELADARAELENAPGELADARQELDDGWQEYYDGVAEAEEKFADAEAELHDAEQEIADGYEELADLKEATTYVLTRNENTGYASFDNDTAIVAAISLVFPVFFFLVAALVCMTTMTRMVDEQRTQIGVLKALGYGNGQIMGKYLFYSGSAAVVGSVAGYAIGSTALPWVIWAIYGIIYGFSPLHPVFLPGLAAMSFAAALLCSMGATYLACRAELKRQAAELIRPKTPKAGRRVFLEYIGPLWRRLSFLHKVSVRNVLRYRSRLIMMVLGIGGCTALLVTGFGIRDSIAHIADDQYDEITIYDYAVTFQEEQTRETAAAYLARHGFSQDQGLLVHSGSVDVITGGGSKSVYLVVSSTDTLEGFISLQSGEEPIAYPGVDQVVLNVGLADKLDVAVGDTVELGDEKLGTLEVTVSAISDNYVFNYVYVAPGTYAKQLGQAPEYNTLYVLAHEGADPYAEGALLLEDDGVGSVTVNESSRATVDNMLSRLNYIVVVVVLCAAALAFIVLYNLTNINITERIREIATIKVLGFYQNEVASYVFREIAILAVLGSLLGLLMGKALHAYVMAQIQIDSMFFACRVAVLSYVWSLALTMLFTAVIALGMRPRLRRIDMAESLKSIE